MPTKRGRKKVNAGASDTVSSAKAQNYPNGSVSSILTILSHHEADEQNQIITAVLTEIRLKRLEKVTESQNDLSQSQNHVNTFESAVNAGLTAQPTPPLGVEG